MNELEKMCDWFLLTNNPKLRAAIRAALDSGAGPNFVRRKWGLASARTGLTACAVDAIVAEWEREVDAIATELTAKQKEGKNA